MARLDLSGYSRARFSGAPLGGVSLATLAALLVALAGCASSPPRVAAVLVGGSVVQEAGGEVEIVRAEAPAPARGGFELQPGDLIRTGPRGQAVLSLEGGRVEVIVFENTEVQISSIFVKIGTVVTRVLRKVKDKFEVESEYAVAGVESTEFLISVGPEEEYRCAVIEGRVEVRSPKGEWPPVSLSRGEQAVGSPGTPAVAREMDQGEFNDLVRRVNAVVETSRPGSAELLVPDVTGLSVTEAVRALDTVFLAAGGMTPRVTGSAPVGTVLEQSPPPGGRISPYRAQVNLVVEAEPTTVPGLSGLPLAEAERRLASASLRAGTVRREITGRSEAGEVLRQQPEPDREVPTGSEVDLWVEAPSVLVPTFTRLLPRQVEALLRQAGLQARAESRLVEGVPDGVVLEQRPAAGTRVEPGTTVHLVVAERGVRMPDLIGSSQRVLGRVLQERGLAAGQTSSRPDRAPPGTIVEQSPRAGTLVRPGTPVHVTVATHCTVPKVVGMSEKAALDAISGAKLSAQVAGFRDPAAYFRQAAELRVAAQDPPAGARVECGSKVTIHLRPVG